MAWIVGFLLVPVILVLKEEYNLHLPVAVPPLSVIVTVIACGLAIGRFRISIAARIGLFLLKKPFPQSRTRMSHSCRIRSTFQLG